MDCIAQRIENCAQFIIDAIGQRHDIEGGQCQIFGKGAGDVDADALGFRVEVITPTARGAAFHADDMAFARYALPDLQIADIRADLNDFACIFMADHHGYRNCSLRPFVPGIDVDVGAADAGLADLDQYIVRSNFGHWPLFQPETRLSVRFDKSFHE